MAENLFADPYHKLDDLVTVERAIRHGWNISPEMRQEIVGVVMDSIRNGKDFRERIRAVSCALQMNAQNIKSDRIDADKEIADKASQRPAMQVNLVTVTNDTVR